MFKLLEAVMKLQTMMRLYSLLSLFTFGKICICNLMGQIEGETFQFLLHSLFLKKKNVFGIFHGIVIVNDTSITISIELVHSLEKMRWW